ncbi:metallophosphoesterase family protein [Sulfitobacter porphyrae]|uniref:Metallophosphoesterase family protein n=1 Tax=Sulfitobacter porphyrae TaxID=1246864 RepID=A0ABW2B9F9_9RHOB
MLNTSLIGSGLPEETLQWDWLEGTLAEAAGKRIFLNIHYPIFAGAPDEPSYYDNVEEPGRSRLLALLREHAAEAVFAGHVHTPFLQGIGATDFYSILSTCFVRHDYAELFHADPAEEFSRNDEPKLGWAEVEVYEKGHVVTFRRMMDTDVLDPALSVRAGRCASLGVQLRTAWADLHPISINGPVDEFVRRRVRNDYTLLALWETGLRDLRVPLADVVEDATFERLAWLVAMGHRLTCYTTQAGPLESALAERLGQLDARTELIVEWLRLEELKPAIAAFRASIAGEVGLACTVSASDHRKDRYTGGYVPMSFGFDPSETEMLARFHDNFGAEHALSYAFRFGPEVCPIEGGAAVAEFARRTNTRATVNLVQIGTDPAAMPADEADIVWRLCEAALIAAAHDALVVHCDTLIDQDRGYFPRRGLYDARINPGPQARAVRRLATWLHDRGTPGGFERNEGAGPSPSRGIPAS